MVVLVAAAVIIATSARTRGVAYRAREMQVSKAFGFVLDVVELN